MATKEQNLQFIKEKVHLACEIIGHPITLSHILRTIQRSTWTKMVSIDIFGKDFTISRVDEDGYEEHCYWDLTKDELNDQSEATISFLAEVLK